MAKQQYQKPSKPQQNPAPQPKKAAPVSRAEKREGIFSTGSKEFIFTRQNYILFGVGLLLVLTGLGLMSGGEMPDPNKWEPEIIYSFRRITLAPILMVAGFVVVVFGIFKKSPAAVSNQE